MGFFILSWLSTPPKDSSPVAGKTGELNSSKSPLDESVDKLSRGIHQKVTDSMKKSDNALRAAKEMHDRDAKFAMLYPPKK